MIVAGGGDYREFLMPGMFAQTMMFGFGLLLLLRFAMIWVGIYLGLTVSEEAEGTTWALLFPQTMISTHSSRRR
jgi:hypothetical protein